jgi:hypothetical protein
MVRFTVLSHHVSVNKNSPLMGRIFPHLER